MAEQEEECGCPACQVSILFPTSELPADRTPVIVGIDVSTKNVAIGIIPALGELDDVATFGIPISAKHDPTRCIEAAERVYPILAQVHQSVDITSVAIEMPAGFGGKIIPMVGAITASVGGRNCEWYAPSTWQKILRSELGIQHKGQGIKQVIHDALSEYLPESHRYWDQINEDAKDSIAIAIAHRTETMRKVSEISDYDMEWLRGQ